MKIKVIFLTRRKGLNFRVFISFLIALFSRDKRQRLNDVKTHTAITFFKNNIEYVREMDSIGVVFQPFEFYYKENKKRIEVKEIEIKDINVFNFYNTACLQTNYKYDFANLLFFQAIKYIFHKFVGKNTVMHRICSEDTVRLLNIILKEKINNPDSVSPAELYKILR